MAKGKKNLQIDSEVKESPVVKSDTEEIAKETVETIEVNEVKTDVKESKDIEESKATNETVSEKKGKKFKKGFKKNKEEKKEVGDKKSSVSDDLILKGTPYNKNNRPNHVSKDLLL